MQFGRSITNLFMVFAGIGLGCGLMAIWDWDDMVVALIIGFLCLVALVVLLVARKHQKKAEAQQRNTYQVMVAFQDMAKIIRGSLGLIETKNVTGADNPFVGLDVRQPMDRETILSFASEVSSLVGDIAERFVNDGCSGFASCRQSAAVLDVQETVQRVLVKFQTFAEVLSSFVSMITQSTNSITAPLSNEILTIKKGVNQFLHDLESWQVESQQKNDAEHQAVIDQFAVHTQRVGNITKEIRRQNEDFRKDLENVINQFSGINDRTRQINEISESVKMLSFNAAIEAARAGASGRGFKVISGEIQKLSLEVQSLVSGITDQMGSTSWALQSVIDKFDKDTAITAQHLVSFNEELKAYDGDLAAYRTAFSGIVKTITDVSLNLNQHMDELAPLFQLQDMTVQQIEHLSVILKRLDEEHAALIDQGFVLPDDKKAEIRGALLSFSEKVATTDGELAIVRELAKQYGLPDEALGRVDENQRSIELF